MENETEFKENEHGSEKSKSDDGEEKSYSEESMISMRCSIQEGLSVFSKNGKSSTSGEKKSGLVHFNWV